MSTLRVNTLETTDGTHSVDIEDLAFFSQLTSIAYLRLFSKLAASRVQVQGYYAPGDGGGGTYALDPTDTSSLDNGGTIIVGIDGGRWKLETTGPISILQFGARVDGVTDDTTAVQNAINWVGTTGGGKVLFPAGTVALTKSLGITYSSVTLEGENRFSSLIKQKTLNTSIINSTQPFFRLNEISMIYDGTPATGATALYSTGSNTSCTGFIIRNAYVGIEVNTGTAQNFSDFQIFDYESIGFYAQSANDIFLSNYVLHAGNESRGALGGIRLSKRVEAFVSVNGDILYGAYSLTTDAVSYSANNRPGYNRFVSTFFDSAAKGSILDKAVEFEFIGCWFSGGRSGAGSPGLNLMTTESIKLNSCAFFNNGTHGLVVSANANGTMIDNCSAESNSVTTGAGVSHGFFFANGAHDFTLMGGRAHNGLYDGVQGYGCFIGTGCDNYSVIGMNLRGNQTGAMNDASRASATSRTVSGCKGFKTSSSGSAVIPSGGTNVVITHGLDVGGDNITPSITPAADPSTAGAARYWISAKTDTTFTISVNAALTGALPFFWQARDVGQ